MVDADPWPLVDKAREYEREHNLTIRAAAKAANLPSTTYFNATRGNKAPTLGTLQHLRRVLGPWTGADF